MRIGVLIAGVTGILIGLALANWSRGAGEPARAVAPLVLQGELLDAPLSAIAESAEIADGAGPSPGESLENPVAEAVPVETALAVVEADEPAPVAEEPVEVPSEVIPEVISDVISEPAEDASASSEPREITWEDLTTFEYEHPDPQHPEPETKDQFPTDIRALHKQRIVMEGHMLPIEFIEDEVQIFMLSRYMRGCCYGEVPMITEWVEVEMIDDRGAEYIPFGTVAVTGTFEVGEVLDELGYVTSIYRIQAESVEEQW